MFEVRFHGRGGQGVVTSAELLSMAAFREGRHAQAFPSFGSERTGAPVVSFCRIDGQQIRLREPVLRPDALLVQDPTLLHQQDLFAGIGPGGIVILNTSKAIEELGIADLEALLGPGNLLTVPATEIAREHLGRPLPGTALLGGFAAASDAVAIETVLAAIRDKFDCTLAEKNCAAASAAHDLVAGTRPGAF